MQSAIGQAGSRRREVADLFRLGDALINIDSLGPCSQSVNTLKSKNIKEVR
jgi:hypothetical protein